MLDSHILTNLLKEFANIFSAGVGNIMGDAKWLLGTLMVIDLVLAIIMNLDDGDHLKHYLARFSNMVFSSGLSLITAIS